MSFKKSVRTERSFQRTVPNGVLSDEIAKTDDKLSAEKASGNVDSRQPALQHDKIPEESVGNERSDNVKLPKM